MSEFLERFPVVTALVLIVAIVGGGVVLFGEGLTFEEYLKNLGIFAGGAGVLGVGRGLAARK